MIVDDELHNCCDCHHSQQGMMIMTEENDPGLRLRDLKVLSVVLRERSLTRAAEVLDTTQPSVSKVLARLRTHFSDPLFVRNGQAMHPTAKALAMADPLQGLLLTADTLRKPAPSFDPRTSDRVFKILTADVGMACFFPAFLSRMAEAGPRLTLQALPLDSGHFEAKLESGEADLAVGAFPKPPRGLRRQRLFFDGYVSVARKDHPKLRKLHSYSEFCAARHIVVEASATGHTAHQIVQQALETEIAQENILVRLPSFVVAMLLAARTEGVATIPAKLPIFFADTLGLATFRPPIPLPPIEIVQYWHERCHRDPGHRWLRSAYFDLFSEYRR
jgi:DNA-binding transcriptional LysR family regulator